MKPAQFAVRRPVTTAMAYVGIIVLGLFSLNLLALDIMPDLEVPALSVVANYEGAGPQEVEKRVTRPLESALGTVPNLKHIYSESREGAAIISMQFGWGTNIDEAANDARTQMGFVKKFLPDDAEEPLIFKFDFSMMPIVNIGATASESLPRLRDILEDLVVDPIKRVPGVAGAWIRGGEQREIKVELDRDRMSAYGITMDAVLNALRMGNLTMPGGHIRTDLSDYLLRVPAEFADLDEVRQLVVGRGNGGNAAMAGGAAAMGGGALALAAMMGGGEAGDASLIRLKHIGTVTDGFREVTRQVRINGKRGAMITVMKQSGANTVEVVEQVRAALGSIRARVPADVDLVPVHDGSRFISNAIANIWQAVMVGGVLVIFIILMFLRSIRSALVVAVSIPTSLIVAFLLMYLGGYTLNMVSLSSLAIAIGMVVDNSIVVLDNVARHRDRGTRVDIAAINGASEVGAAVVASTATTVAIFLPVIFVGGIMGMMFKQLAAIVSLTLAASLFVALTLVPLVSSRVMARVGTDPGRAARWLGQRLTDIEVWYGKRLDSAVRRPWRVLAGGTLLFAATMGLVGLVGIEFMPHIDEGNFSTQLRLPTGTESDITGAMAQEMERIIEQQVPERIATVTSWGYGGEGMQAMFSSDEGSELAEVSTMLAPSDARSRGNKEIAESLRPAFTRFAGATLESRAVSPMQTLIFGGGKPIQIEVTGHDLEASADLAQEVAQRMGRVRGLADIEISRREGKPELRVEIDREKAAALGVSPAAVAMTVNHGMAGTVATQFRSGGDEFDLTVRLRPEDRAGTEDVERLLLRTPTGGTVQVGNVAHIGLATSPTKIDRKDQQRVIYVKANLVGRDLNSAASELQATVDAIPLPPGIGVAQTGEREEQLEAFRLVALAFVLGVLLVYMVMAAIFESFLLPFIILFTIPFAIVGVIWGLVMSGETLSVTSAIGVLILVGIVVNNGIVLIDYMNLLRARGHSVLDAVREGGRSRLRPVLMTAVTTIGGMVPLTTATGEGSEIWRGMGIAVIGGLFASTAVTLLFVPTLYAVIASWRERVGKRTRAPHHDLAASGAKS